MHGHRRLVLPRRDRLQGRVQAHPAAGSAAGPDAAAARFALPAARRRGHGLRPEQAAAGRRGPGPAGHRARAGHPGSGARRRRQPAPGAQRRPALADHAGGARERAAQGARLLAVARLHPHDRRAQDRHPRDRLEGKPQQAAQRRHPRRAVQPAGQPVRLRPARSLSHAPGAPRRRRHRDLRHPLRRRSNSRPARPTACRPPTCNGCRAVGSGPGGRRS